MISRKSIQKKSLKKNLIYNTIYQITVLILPFLTAPYISRIVGAKGLGLYSYYHSIALYFVYFAMIGFANYGNRKISKNSNNQDELDETFSSIYALQLFTAVVAFIIYILFALFFVKEDKFIVWIMTFHVISSLFDVSWLFFGLQEFKITSIRQIIIKILSFVSIFLFVKNKNDLWIYTLIMSLSYFFSSFSLWILMFKKVNLKKCSVKKAFSHLKPCLILFIPIIATSIYRVMDKIMIGNFSSMVEVGYYENAEKIILISLGILNAFTAVIMPRISNLISKNKNNEAIILFNHSMEIALCIGFAIAFGISVVSSEFIPIFFGKEFTPSILISIALCVTVPFISWSTIVRSLYIIPYEKDSIYIKSVIIGAVLNFVFNLIFIPKFASFGAVIGTFIAEFSLAFYQSFKIRKEITLKKYLSQALVFGTIGFVMFLVVYFFKIILLHSFNNTIKLVIEILVGSFIYCLLSLLYFYKKKSDFILKIIKRGKIS